MSPAANPKTLSPTLLACAQAFASGTRAGAPLWVQRLRKQGLHAFERLGLPTVKDESWRFTHLGPLASLPLGLAEGDDPFLHDAAERALAGLALPAGPLLVFVNGHFHKERSYGLGAGVRFERLETTLATDSSGVEAHLTRHAPFAERPFTALNTAFLEDGAFLFVPDGVVLSEPIQILHLAAATQGDGAEAVSVLSHPRTLLILGKGSQATVVERFIGTGPELGLVNAVTEAVLLPGAVLEHDLLQMQGQGMHHVSTLFVHQGRDSRFVSNLFSFGARMARNEVELVLDGEGAHGTLNGLAAATGNQHVDNHSVIDHVKPHGSSQEFYKSVLSGEGRAIFDGKIIVRLNATKTDAHQKNKNLLLSDRALVDSKPQLEIYNNDVRCTHGSTTGRLDPDSIFYLRSRGLDEAAARALLIHAFAAEMIQRVGAVSLRAELERTLAAWLSATGEVPQVLEIA